MTNYSKRRFPKKLLFYFILFNLLFYSILFCILYYFFLFYSILFIILSLFSFFLFSFSFFLFLVSYYELERNHRLYYLACFGIHSCWVGERDLPKSKSIRYQKPIDIFFRTVNLSNCILFLGPHHLRLFRIDRRKDLLKRRE